jgi:hypothetical protein
MKADQLKFKGDTLYIDNIPSFMIKGNGVKEPLNPRGWMAYRSNQQMIDDWLEYRFRSREH